jgi:alcohol dehydrogenase class IV
MAFSNARLGAVHGIAHPLGARYHLAHGAVCGLLLPHVMRYNADHATKKYALVANIVGAGAGLQNERARAMAAVEWVAELVAGIGVPTSLSELGVPREDWPDIAVQSLTSSSLKHNPRPFATEDVYAILEAASRNDS